MFDSNASSKVCRHWRGASARFPRVLRQISRFVWQPWPASILGMLMNMIVRGSGGCVRPRCLATKSLLRAISQWHVHAAQAALRSMQAELLGKRLISFFMEWCGTEYKPTKGCAATESCWIFVDEGPLFIKAIAAASEKDTN